VDTRYDVVTGLLGNTQQTIGSNMNATAMANQIGMMRQPKFYPTFVDLATIKSYFYPEKYSAIHTDLNSYLPMATVKASDAVQLPTSAANNLIAIFNPAATDGTALLTMGNVNPVTGAFTVLITIPSPIVGSTIAETAILVSASTNFVSSVANSTNSTGTTFMWHDPLLYDTFTTAFPVTGSSNTTLVNYKNRPFSQSASINLPLRQLTALNNLVQRTIATPTSVGNGLVGSPTVWYFEGLVGNVVPGYIEYTVQYNVADYSTGLRFTVPTQPMICGMTQNFIQAISCLNPSLYQADPKWLYEYFCNLDDVEPTYEQLLYRSEAYFQKCPITINRVNIGGSNLDVQEISFEKCSYY
jgi:hypothetical protein